jgi:hypothetical protein
MRAARETCPWRQSVFIENLEGAEAVGEGIRPVLHVEREPDLVPAASVVVALPSSAERDHRGPTSSPAS